MSAILSAMPDFLTHSSDADPGLTRRVRGKGFSYHDSDGALVRDAATLERIKALGLPPAWTGVWICPHPFGHIQATGRDARSRKQYRYHEAWREFRDRQKFDALPAFGEALPALRARVRRDLSRETPDREFVCAALVRLLDRAALRVGTDAYARENGAFGATTLRMKHACLAEDGTIRLDYRAKGGKRVRKQIGDRTLHRAMERIADLPGRELFHFLEADGTRRGIDSADVNAYLGQTLEANFTAKTFRTWRGSVAAFEALTKGAGTIKALSEAASEALHNTPAICRSSYIHPRVIDMVELDPDAREARLEPAREARRSGLRAAEAGLLALLGD